MVFVKGCELLEVAEDLEGADKGYCGDVVLGRELHSYLAALVQRYWQSELQLHHIRVLDLSRICVIRKPYRQCALLN